MFEPTLKRATVACCELDNKSMHLHLSYYKEMKLITIIAYYCTHKQHGGYVDTNAAECTEIHGSNSIQ
jgi:hypothetical protein